MNPKPEKQNSIKGHTMTTRRVALEAYVRTINIEARRLDRLTKTRIGEQLTVGQVREWVNSVIDTVHRIQDLTGDLSDVARGK